MSKKNIKEFLITTNIFRIQASDSVMCVYFCIEFIDFILKGKSLTGYTNLLKWVKHLIYIYIYIYIYPNLNDQQLFRLNKINETKYYSTADITERELMSKRLSKYIASFDYFGKSLIVLSAASCSISIASFEIVIGTPVGIASANLSIAFSISTGMIKKLLKTTQNRKKKHNKIVVLARSKLNSIKSKISEALISNEISHEDFMTIINKEKNYRELKESIRMMKSQKSHTEKINLIEEDN